MSPFATSPLRVWVARGLRAGIALSALWLLVLIVMSIAVHEVPRPRFEAAGLSFGILFIAFVLLELWQAPLADSDQQTQVVRLSLALMAIPAAIAALSFVWSIPLGPLSDDYVLSSWARTGTLINQDWTYARPFPLLLWAILLKLGAGWSALHLLNVACHAATAVLVSAIAAEVCRSRAAGILCGVVFALFPANFETVAWTAGVFDAIATLSVVTAAAVLLLSARVSWRQMAIVAVLGVIAVLSKETGVMLPFLLACLLPFARGRDRGRLYAVLLSTAAVVGLYIVIRASVVGQAIASRMPESPWELKNSLVRPFVALAMPFHHDAPEWLAPLAAFSLIAVCLIAVLLKRPAASRGLAAMAAGAVWILLATVPLLNQFFVAGDLQGSRYLYLPLVGLCLAIAGAFTAARVRWLSAGAIALLCVTWLLAWPAHLKTWREAAALRDVVLSGARQFVTEHRCGALDVKSEPDNVRGAYVFRTGVTDALQRLPYQVDGPPCAARWVSGRWVPIATQ